MFNALSDMARAFLLALDGERAHELTLRALASGLYPRLSNCRHQQLRTNLWGLDFPNPVGMAAGFDKNARVIDATLAMGFGFTEVGTVTPRAQTGNPAPRVFRLAHEGGLINRLGFNNDGHDVAHLRLRLCRDRTGQAADGCNGIVGVNIGANKTTNDRVEDYVAGLHRFWDVADYFMINISSPNTPGLRDLQVPDALAALLKRITKVRKDLADATGTTHPIVVKLSPDIAEDDLPAIIACIEDSGIDGIALTNTTLARPGLDHNPQAKETGGLSGRPLFHRSTVILARVYQLTHGRIPLIGIGGIDSGAAALTKIRAGASLVQLYTGLIYGGAGVIADIHKALAEHVKQNNLASISVATGKDAQDWASRTLDG